MSTSKPTFGRFLQIARERKGLTLRAVEKVTGISNPYLSQLESGKIKQPSPVHLHKLSDLYQVSYADVLALAGYPIPDHQNDTEFAQFSSRFGPLTSEEEEALAEYLDFMRSKRKRGTQK